MEKPKISLKEFLAKSTTFSEKFIDDYCLFRELGNSLKFGIDLDKVVEFLGIHNKERFYNNFRSKYLINIHYIVEIFKIRGNNKARRKIYYISFDTFCRICMSSRTKKGDLCREYFMIMEKFANYYREHIMEVSNENVLREIMLDSKFISLIHVANRVAAIPFLYE